MLSRSPKAFTLSVCFIFLIGIVHQANAQQLKRISFFVHGNYPILKDSRQDGGTAVFYRSSSGFIVTTPALKQNHVYKESLGGNAGIDIAFGIDQKFSISTGLSVTHFKFTHQVQIESYPPLTTNPGTVWPGWSVPGDTTGTTRLRIISTSTGNQGETSLTFVAIPAMVDFAWRKRWIFSLGVSAHLLAQATTYKYMTKGNPPANYLIGKDTSSDGFVNFNVAPQAKINFLIWDKFSADLSFSYFVNSIYDESTTLTYKQPKLMSASFGLRYWLKR
jgi:hypothetical protein